MSKTDIKMASAILNTLEFTKAKVTKHYRFSRSTLNKALENHFNNNIRT